MADQEPSFPQANDTTSSKPNISQLPPSPPLLPISSSQCSGKPKKRPTVTPRTFTRFFTPRSSLGRCRKIGASRQTLRDITASASNRMGLPHWRTPRKDSVEKIDNDDGGIRGTSRKRKRKVPVSPDTTPDRSSPLKRIQKQMMDIPDDTEDERTDSEDELAEGSPAKEGKTNLGKSKLINPIESKLHGRTGWFLSREIGGSTWPRAARGACHGGDWQSETSNFFTNPDDMYVCDNVEEPHELALPFCTTSCNTNSLIAIGDEEGSVRILETQKDAKPEFSKAYLTFRPHQNAILDMEFSPDDLLLATGSGDQSAQIIDMPTQLGIYTLAGHVSSVKQTRFQPGSSNIIATSSRDGSVQIWDLRCKGFDAPVRTVLVSLEPAKEETMARAAAPRKMTWARSVNTFPGAHCGPPPMAPNVSGSSKPPSTGDAPSKTESPGRRGDVSVTGLAFLRGREHLFLTASEANATVKLWDLRTTHTNRRRHAIPLSTTRQPESHTRHRHFGLTSLTLSTDGARLYTLCRDNTVYAYATSHLILGHAPELSLPAPKARRAGGAEKEGLGPLYGLRHPSFRATSFYVKSALRPAVDDKSELLAVGSSDGCAILFPTDERYLQRPPPHRSNDTSSPFLVSTPRNPLSRTDSGTGLAARLNDTIPIYQHGSALVRGHDQREVSGLTWTINGDLVSVGDDSTARCWREGRGGEARNLRLWGEGEGKRWACGWAEVYEEWDDDDG